MKRKKKVTIRNKKLKYFNTIEVGIIMTLTCLLGIFLGSIITFATTKSKKETCDIKEDKYIKEFTTAYNNILSNYYNNIDNSKLIDSAIKGMIDYLDDPYATFLDTEDSISFSEEVEGEYEGIGCEISINDNKDIIITKIYKNSPAYKVGLKKNDVIISVNDQDIKNIDITNVVNMIKKNKTNIIVIKRNDIEKTFKVTKQKIVIPSVSSDIIKNNSKKIGIITIKVFASNTDEQFKNNLEKLEKQNIDSLIIDVRDNNGGYLSTVTEISSMMLAKNKVIYQLNYKGVKEPIIDKTKEKRTYPIVVLINENTASASEILASSLKESSNAILVGTNSYGKGKVQKAYNLSDGSIMKYTIEEWLTAKGNSIDKVGIKPDIEEQDINKQLDKAIEVLSN